MNDFDYDVMQKKRLAYQAKYRKCGSKSRKCPLSTDHMPRKQWEERCGKLYTYNLNEPQTWENFKKWPGHIQNEYLELLVKNYNINETSLAMMFGVRPLTVRRYIGANNLGITFKAGNSMNAAQKDRWIRFIAGDTAEQPAEVPAGQGEPHDDPPEVVVNPPALQTNSMKNMDMKQFSLTFQGRIDVGMIANSILSIMGQGASGKIEIVCTL